MKNLFIQLEINRHYGSGVVQELCLLFCNHTLTTCIYQSYTHTYVRITQFFVHQSKSDLPEAITVSSFISNFIFKDVYKLQLFDISMQKANA